MSSTLFIVVVRTRNALNHLVTFFYVNTSEKKRVISSAKRLLKTLCPNLSFSNNLIMSKFFAACSNFDLQQLYDTSFLRSLTGCPSKHFTSDKNVHQRKKLLDNDFVKAKNKETLGRVFFRALHREHILIVLLTIVS